MNSIFRHTTQYYENDKEKKSTEKLEKLPSGKFIVKKKFFFCFMELQFLVYHKISTRYIEICM